MLAQESPPRAWMDIAVRSERGAGKGLVRDHPPYLLHVLGGELGRTTTTRLLGDFLSSADGGADLVWNVIAANADIAKQSRADHLLENWSAV